MKNNWNILLPFAISLAFSMPAGASGYNVGPSYVASPDVYKLISENEHFRVIQAVWKPGQRDEWHSHAGGLATYRLTDCKMRSHTPDGKVVETDTKRGAVNYNPIIHSHSLENIGTTECEVLIVERK